MGGKTSTSTSTVSIPPEVLARYNAVNARAENVAATPFQGYGGQFVAPINPTQQAGIQATSQAAGAAQPYYGAATGLTLAGAQDVGALTPGQIAYYQNPYTEAVAQPTLQALQQQQGQERAKLLGQQAMTGAFGGDRAGLERANLARQQTLGTAQAIAPIYQQGFGQAAQIAAGQQGVVAQDLARRMQAGQQIAGLGTGAQQAALQGAQAQIGAGTLEQQTQQADLTARYQQFLQERGYPFQVAQFLANIAMGTGALSGSTTTTTQPSSFFSDERLKENIQPIGETFDGQPIYKYNYKGEPGTQIGLLAQDVERKHPEAVGEAAGFKTVNYDRATEEAAERGATGLVPRGWMGGAVHEPGSFARGGYALSGAVVDPTDMRAILESNRQSLAPFAQAGLYGGPQGQNPMGGKSFVPPPSLATPKGVAPAAPPRPQESGFKQMMGELQSGQNMYESLAGEKGLFGEKGMIAGLRKKFGPEEKTPTPGQNQGSNVAAGPPAKAPAAGVAPTVKAAEASNASVDAGVAPKQVVDVQPDMMPMNDNIQFVAHGGVIHRRGYAGLGKVIDPMELQDPSKGVGAYIDDATESQDKPENLQTPGTGGGGGKSGGLGSDLMTAGNLAMMGAKAAPMVAEGFSALMAALPFSDARLKDNIRPVGKTYDGQNIYSYDMGDGRTQMGLMAQEVLGRKPEAVGQRDGFLTLDYDRATEDAAPRYRGGVAPRMGFQEGGDAPKYLVEPMNYEDMPEHRQMLIKAIYGPESGGRYDIRQGGQETFDTSGPHPGRTPAKGGESSAAGAGQFIYDTWNRVTGGAPMTKGYQDAATWKLASDDYARRTGRDLDADLKEKGVTPEIKSALAPTWVGLGAGKTTASASDGVAGPEKSWALRNLPTRVNQKGEEEVNVKQMLIPALVGLGQMAASPSRYFGAAALQGLGAGAQAYANLEQQQANIQQTEATTAKTMSDILGNSFLEGGKFIKLANGRIMPTGQWMAMGDQAPDIYGGSVASGYLRQYLNKYGVPSISETAGGAGGAGKEGTGAKPAVAAPAAPEAPEAPKPFQPSETTKPSATTGFIGSASRELAKTDANNYYGPSGASELEKSRIYQDQINKAASAAQQNRVNMNDLAKMTALQASQKGFETPGLAFAQRAEVIRALDTLSSAVGGQRITGAQNVKDMEDKIKALIATASAAGVPSETLGALQMLAQAVPSQKMTPETQAELTAQLMVANRTLIDRQKHLIDYRNLPENRYVGNLTNASYAFDRDNSARIQADQQLIKRAILTQPAMMQKITTGKLTPEQMDTFFHTLARDYKMQYAPGMYRYFQG